MGVDELVEALLGKAVESFERRRRTVVGQTAETGIELVPADRVGRPDQGGLLRPMSTDSDRRGEDVAIAKLRNGPVWAPAAADDVFRRSVSRSRIGTWSGAIVTVAMRAISWRVEADETGRASRRQDHDAGPGGWSSGRREQRLVGHSGELAVGVIGRSHQRLRILRGPFEQFRQLFLTFLGGVEVGRRSPKPHLGVGRVGHRVTCVLGSESRSELKRERGIGPLSGGGQRQPLSRR